ncbi:unnamed protein product [Trichogramma brassicae]|uniref:Uncharacterized protein n=1 Tax=Trichogramma brassicae TaxID=86971 RepID=A0A6H5J589_9HYME|nr:unnamed protein product [Trichogramma brassicae]
MRVRTTIGVRLSALRKKCEDCQLRQVMRMNSYDDRCATFGITEKVRGLPVTASDAYDLYDDRCATFGITKKCEDCHYGSDAYELVRRVCATLLRKLRGLYGGDRMCTTTCEDCQLRQVMRMNSYDDRCATFGITEKVRGLPVTAGDAYELVRRSCATFGLTKKVRGLREMSTGARALTAWRVLARASTSDRSASSPGAFSTRRAADRRLAHDQARPCIGH